jgi:uncharacterized protein YpmB
MKTWKKILMWIGIIAVIVVIIIVLWGFWYAGNN